MRRPLRMALRFMAIVAALTLIAAIFAPSRPDSSPYVSAFADLTVGSALAQTTCHKRVCNRGGTKCNKVTRLQNCVLGVGTCTNVDC